MEQQDVTVLDGSTFAVSDDHGDIRVRPGEAAGIFFRDMRHLSRWELRVVDHDLRLLTCDTPRYDEVTFFLAEETADIDRNATLSVQRRRCVADGVREEITVINHASADCRVELVLTVDADFASIFEVKGRRDSGGTVERQVDGESLTFSFDRGGYRRETTVSASAGTLTDGSVRFVADLGAHESASVTLEISMTADGRRHGLRSPRHPHMQLSLEEWLAAAPRLDTDWDDLRHCYSRSLTDLAALRFYPRGVQGSVPAAGMPWFMALFGRDSLLTAYQALPFAPELARSALVALAQRQATQWDDFRDAEPGKILHELRHDDLTASGEQPQSPYYGSADSTPLFLVVLDEYERWTGDSATVRELEPAARAAVEWMRRYGDLDGDGYIEYRRRNEDTGLANQCWKDSPTSIVHPDGTLASLPRATCELQGYAYDARRRAARLARTCWADLQLADRLEVEAAALKKRFTRDFWSREDACYALALDGEDRQVRTVASNAGQLLWSGIVPDDHVDELVDRLFRADLFSGWGVRTLATGQDVYNPLGYHTGTVWPHDNSLIAMGLRRYGRHDEAVRLVRALVDASGHFEHRLPEAFAGYPRADTQVPVRYPTACSPQAWASGTPLLLLRVLLGLEPSEHGTSADPWLDDVPYRVRLHERG